MKAIAGPRVQLRWYTVRDAAAILGVTPGALRRRIEREAQKLKAKGLPGTDISFDEIRACKYGNLWRVSLGDRWTA